MEINAVFDEIRRQHDYGRVQLVKTVERHVPVILGVRHRHDLDLPSRTSQPHVELRQSDILAGPRRLKYDDPSISRPPLMRFDKR